MNKYVLIILILILNSCEFLSNWNNQNAESEAVSDVPVARVNNIVLYKKDIESLFAGKSQYDDSLSIVSQYVDSWIKKQLMISKAAKEVEFNTADIERKVLDYRYSLMVHDYEKHYISQNINKEVSEEEISTYYREKFENFVLRQNIVRCLFAKIPKQAPQINRFRNQIRSFPEANVEEIQSYCYRFATKSSLEPEIWLNFDEVISTTPLANVQDRVTFLKNNSFVETSDEEYYYYIRVLDFKISNQIAPLEFIRDDIESILINKKKVELRKSLEDQVYLEAKENEAFEIY